MIERAAGDVGEDLPAAGAEILHGAAAFAHGLLGIVHVDRGDEGGEAVLMFCHQLGHRIVGRFAQLGRHLLGGDVLDRRIGQRDDLAVALARDVHLAETQVEIEYRLHASQACADRAELRGSLGEGLEERIGKDVRVDVDDLHGCILPRAQDGSHKQTGRRIAIATPDPVLISALTRTSTR